jgi:hypothetical protein
MKCDDCGSNNFVEHYAELVCTKCGLVSMTVLDDRAICTTFLEMESRHTSQIRIPRLHLEESAYDKQFRQFHATLKHLDLDDMFLNTASYFLQTIDIPRLSWGVRGTVSSYFASYYLDRGNRIDEFAELFKTRPSDAWNAIHTILPQLTSIKEYAKIKTCLLNHTDKITRSVYANRSIFVFTKDEDGSSKHLFNICKIAKKIYKSVHALPNFRTYKTHCLIAACIWTGCLSISCNVDMQMFCEKFNVSKHTLKCHLAQLQTTLQKLIS